MSHFYPCDLHVHSNWSDGDSTPRRVFQEAKRRGLKAIILTEHDITKGLDGTYARLARSSGLTTLQGVEISTKYQGMEVHILGYSTNFNLPLLRQGLAKTVRGMESRARMMLRKLRALGQTALTYQDIAKKLPSEIVVVKYHISTAIARERNLPLAEVRKLMHGGGAAEVPVATAPWAMSPRNAVRLIHRAGGAAVIAHPGNYRGFNRFPAKRLERLIDELTPQLVRAGLDGLEVRTAKHTSAQLKKYNKIARRYRLIETGGSDWHGYIKSPDRNLGDGGLTINEFKKLVARLK